MARSSIPRVVWLGSLLFLVVIVAMSFGLRAWLAERRAATDRVIAEQTRRQTAVAPVVPGPPAPVDETPLLGPGGNGPDGYPTRYVNRLVLRRMLHAGQYAELTKQFETFQGDFEENPRCEYWPDDAAEAFSSAETSQRERLDAWVKTTPDSFAPYLARGRYLAEVGYQRRGKRIRDKTDDLEMAAMKATMPEAIADFEKALSLRPKLVAALRGQINAALPMGDQARIDTAVKSALSICPTCLLVRITYLQSLRPRWGGSHALMAKFAASAPTRINPRLRWLMGYADLDRASLLLGEKNYIDARKAVDAAMAFGDNPYAFYMRGDVLGAHGELADAEIALNRSNELRPQVPDVLVRRARVRTNLKAWEGAGVDLLDALRLCPTQDNAKDLVDYVVPWLVKEAWDVRDNPAYREEALRKTELALDLQPGNKDAERRYSFLIAGTKPATEEEVARMRVAVVTNPDDFRAFQSLDYALSRQRKFDEILGLWNSYLSRHPSDGRAYAERSGTLTQLGRGKEASDDALRSCQLGVARSCKYVEP